MNFEQRNKVFLSINKLEGLLTYAIKIGDKAEEERIRAEQVQLVGCEFVHFKGGHYRLRGFAKDSETLETMVVYEALYGEGGLWVRPAKMFFENVTRDGKTFPRFKLVGQCRSGEV